MLRSNQLSYIAVKRALYTEILRAQLLVFENGLALFHERLRGFTMIRRFATAGVMRGFSIEAGFDGSKLSGVKIPVTDGDIVSNFGRAIASRGERWAPLMPGRGVFFRVRLG